MTTQIKAGTDVWEIQDHEWPHWVRSGWVPADALILSPRWTKGNWRVAGSLEVYHLYLPSPSAARDDRPTEDVKRRGLFSMFRAPGISVTEVMIALNVLVGLFMLLYWRDAYGTDAGIWGLSAELRSLFFDGWFPVLLIPLFMHASLEHLGGNMLTLLASGAAVEEYYGRKRILAIYLFSGITGALLSLARPKDVLSVGASGAIMGLFGAALVFLVRSRSRMPARHRWKLRRVYLPFFALMVLPAILHADFYAHLGGFLGGAFLALFVPPLPERLPGSSSEQSSHAEATGPIVDAPVGSTVPGEQTADPTPGSQPPGSGTVFRQEPRT